MSGKLKFRVWNPTYQEMLYPSSPTKNGDYEEKIYLQLDGQLIGDFKHTGLVNCSENYVIQQFTGMLDNNGKEIYEGDVIRGYFDMGPAGMTINTTIVRWTNKEGYQWKYWDLNSIEVLGNIFENKDLICDHTKCHMSVNGNCYNCGKLIFPNEK